MVNINNLAVAVYMNSRYGWFNEGQTEGPAAHLNRELVDAFYDKKESHLGMAYTLARIATAPWVTAPGQWEEGALRWNFYDCNLLGDAALRFWPDEPMQINLNYEDTLFLNSTSCQLAISGNGNLEGLYCHFVKDSISYGIAETDENGIANITFSQAISGVGEAKIYVSGYDCGLHEYLISIIQNPITHFQTVWNTPFNPMTIYVEEVTIDGINIQAGDEIGIFDVDPNTSQQICVGVGTLAQELSGGAFLEITASMDDGSNPEEVNGFTPGNEIIYRLWNVESGEITNVAASYPYPGYDETFNALGTAITQLSGSVLIAQQITLPAGWSGISSWLIPENTNMETLLSDISGQVEVILDMNEFFIPAEPSGNLTAWDYKSGYYIKTSSNTVLNINGTNPGDRTINLSSGWNLLPVLSAEPVLLSQLFQGNLDKIVVIKDAVGFNVFWPSENIVALQVLNPGQAYLVKTTENIVVNY